MGMDCPYLADAWWRSLGRAAEDEGATMPPLSVLMRTEWSQEFESAMRVRMVMGAFRYGRLGDPEKPKYDRMGFIKRRVELFQKTQNKELLVDIANLCLLQFVEGEGTFTAIDDGEHVQRI